MTVRELLARTDSRELGEWMAEDSLRLDERRQAELAYEAERKLDAWGA